MSLRSPNTRNLIGSISRITALPIHLELSPPGYQQRQLTAVRLFKAISNSLNSTNIVKHIHNMHDLSV